MKIKLFFLAFFVGILVLNATHLVAKAAPSQEQVDLFVASRQMQEDELRKPQMRLGMMATTLGSDSEVSLGVKVENTFLDEPEIRIVTETIYLKSESTLAGFLSIKYVKELGERSPALYAGAGLGYAKGVKYQIFAGVEIGKNFFADARYINLPGGLADKQLYLATGFQFLY